MHTDENRNISDAKHALDLLVKEAGACEDREQLEKVAASILGAELGDRYGVAQRVCDAFNSNKALYKLSSADVNVRENDFAILDSAKVIGLMKKNASGNAVKKLANLQPKFYANTPEKATEPEMEKTASAFNPAECIEIDQRPGFEKVTLINSINHQEDLLNKLAFAYDRAEDELTTAKDTFARHLSHIDVIEKTAAAGIGAAYYGALFQGVAELFGKVELKKYASAPVLPEGKTYQLMNDCVEKAYIRDNYKALIKTACADLCNNMRKLAGAYNLSKLRMRKEATIGAAISGMLGGAVFPEALGLKDENKQKLYSSILNQNVANILRELEMKRNFYEIYNDDYISTFPIHQVQDAYNAAIQKLPERLKAHPSSATQLVRSWVTKQLSHGGVTSAEDAADVLEAASKLRFERGADENPFEDED